MSYVVKARGTGPEVAPATWGQLAMERCIRRATAMPGYFNFGELIRLAPPRSPEDLVAGLERWASRFHILRTRFEGSGRDLRQVVCPYLEANIGRVVAERSDVERAATELHVSNVSEEFDQTNGPQWRMLLIAGPDDQQYLSICLNHMIVDHLGWMVLRAELVRALDGAEIRAPAWNAIDQSRFECSEAGRAVNRRVLARMESIFRDPPRYSRRRSGDEAVRYQAAKLYSPVLPSKVTELSRRAHVSESAILLSAYVSTLGDYLQSDEVIVQLLCSNRYDQRRRRLPANLAWDSPSVLVRCPDFMAQTRDVFTRSIDAYRHGLYNPLDADELVRSLLPMADRDALTGIHFNDGRRRPTAAPAVERSPAGEAVREVGYFDNELHYFDAAIYLEVRDIDSAGNYRLDLICDTAVLSRVVMLDFLGAVEAKIFDEGK